MSLLALSPLLLLARVGPPAPQAGNAHDQQVFVELDVPRASYFVEQPIRAKLRLVFDPQFLEHNVIPIFQQALDVPVQVQWPAEWPGALALGETAVEGAATRTFVLDERVVRGRLAESQWIGGRSFTVLELERSFVAEHAGRLQVPVAKLRFAYATQFQEDFLQGRVPQDRVEVELESTAFELEVLRLPDAGRPADFSGAVGHFALEARSQVGQVALGEAFEVELIVRGEGNLTRFPAPWLDRLEGLRMLGFVEDQREGERRITYEFAASSARVREFPSLPFAFFDPTPPAGYTTLWTKPIALHVEVPSGSAEPGAVAGHAGEGIEAAGSVMVVAGVLAAIVVLVVALIVWLALGLRRAPPR